MAFNTFNPSAVLPPRPLGGPSPLPSFTGVPLGGLAPQMMPPGQPEQGGAPPGWGKNVPLSGQSLAGNPPPQMPPLGQPEQGPPAVESMTQGGQPPQMMTQGGPTPRSMMPAQPVLDPRGTPEMARVRHTQPIAGWMRPQGLAPVSRMRRTPGIR